MTDSLSIIQSFDLDKYLKIILLENKSNTLPYHNIYHILCMVKHVRNFSYSSELSQLEIKNLIIAVLFHDFNHSGGKLTDDKNIEVAITEFKKHSEESDENTNKIINIIKATQYPYVLEDTELNISQKIIRDADMCQVFMDNKIQQVIFGLGVQEMDKSLKETLPHQIAFLTNLKMHTEQGKYMLEMYKKNILKELNYLNILIQ